MRRFLHLVLAVALGCSAGWAFRRVPVGTVAASMPGTVTTDVPLQLPSPQSEVAQGKLSELPAPPLPEAVPTGWAVRGKRIVVQMSDGTTRTDRDKEVALIYPNSVTLRGRKYYLGSGAKRAPASPVQPGAVAQGAPGVAVVSSGDRVPPVAGNATHEGSQVQPVASPIPSPASGGDVSTDSTFLPPDKYGVQKLRDPKASAFRR